MCYGEYNLGFLAAFGKKRKRERKNKLLGNKKRIVHIIDGQ